MTGDDIRKLLGGYATGSLTEADRRMLFEAALEDQDLFDELAREQALKELLDQPGARQRLIAASQAARGARPVSGMLWPWAVAAIAITAVILAGVLWFRPVHKNAEIAVVAKPVPGVQPVPVPASRPAPPAPPRPKRPPAPVAAPETKPETKVKEDAQVELPPNPPAVPPPRVVGGVVAGFLATGAPRAAVAIVPRIALDYALDPNGQLRITPAADGFLRVFSVAADGVRQVLAGPDSPVRAGSPISVRVPAGASSVRIQLSLVAGLAEQPFSPLDAVSGTVEDSNSWLSVSIPVKPRE